MQHYFAQDGNYGDAEEILIVDTDLWNEEDWQEIEDAYDGERASVAQRISERYYGIS